jgi:hypothetical protein
MHLWKILYIELVTLGQISRSCIWGSYMAYSEKWHDDYKRRSSRLLQPVHSYFKVLPTYLPTYLPAEFELRPCYRLPCQVSRGFPSHTEKQSNSFHCYFRGNGYVAAVELNFQYLRWCEMVINHFFCSGISGRFLRREGVDKMDCEGSCFFMNTFWSELIMSFAVILM